MKKIYIYLLLGGLFILSGCSKSCDEIMTTTSNYNTYSSSVIVFGDGCNALDGSTSDSKSTIPEPTGLCDGNGDAYAGRGRWVKLPKVTAEKNSQITVNVYGSIFYCSTGYDNRNISPRISVKAIPEVQTVFEDGSEIPIEEKQTFILDIADTGAVSIGTGTGLPTCDPKTYYNSFINGTCQTNGGRGLSIYVKNQDTLTEIVTLDNITQNDTSPSTYKLNTSRYPNLYQPLVPESGQEAFFTWVEAKYSANVETAGPNRYIFSVPEKLSGVLGFNIAQGREGLGEYSIEVMSTPPACMVEESIIESSNEGGRGALMFLIESTDLNPNEVDNVLDTFNAYDSDISEYYPELVNFIASIAGVELSVYQDSTIGTLSTMKVSSVGTSTLDPYVMTDSTYDGTALKSGNIWFKVKDDYYHDNVGHYEVYVEVKTKKQSLVSEFLNYITTPVFDAINSASATIYDSFAEDSRFQNIMKMCLMLYIMIWGAQFILGLNGIAATDAVIRFLKIAVVIQLFDSSSWNFFNDYFFKLFTDGKDYLITSITGDQSSDRSGVFGFIDDIFYLFFAKETWEKFLALTPSLVGVIYVIIFIQVMCIYLVAISEVFLVYLLTIVGISFLLSLAPMFFVAMLFERTKKIFSNWVKSLADYAMQPVILFAVLYVVNQIFMTLWNNAMDFRVCYGGVWRLWFWGGGNLDLSGDPCI